MNYFLLLISTHCSFGHRNFFDLFMHFCCFPMQHINMILLHTFMSLANSLEISALSKEWNNKSHLLVKENKENPLLPPPPPTSLPKESKVYGLNKTNTHSVLALICMNEKFETLSCL